MGFNSGFKGLKYSVTQFYWPIWEIDKEQRFILCAKHISVSLLKDRIWVHQSVWRTIWSVLKRQQLVPHFVPERCFSRIFQRISTGFLSALSQLVTYHSHTGLFQQVQYLLINLLFIGRGSFNSVKILLIYPACFVTNIL